MTIAISLRRNATRLWSSGYARAVATLSTGQLFSAAIPIFAAPILGRLYVPVDYGMLATYMAIANILAVVGTMQMELAIISERSEQAAIGMVALCQWLALGSAVPAALIGVAAYFWIGSKPEYAAARAWMLLMPLSVASAGPMASIRMLANRAGNYRALAYNATFAAVVTVSISILLGAFHWGADGLFISYFAGQITSLVLYLILYRQLAPRPVHTSFRRLMVLARRNREYMQFTLPSEAVGTLNRQLPTFALTILGAASLLGGYSRARQLIAMPLNLLGASIAQVFRQRASEQFRLTGSCELLYRKTFLVLLAVGILPTLFLAALAPDLMRIYLGPKWGEAGRIAQILSPMLLAGFVTSPLSSVFYFQGRQREELVLNSAGAVLLVVATTACIWANSGTFVIAAYSASFTLIYLVYLMRGWMIARGKREAQT